MTPNPYPAPPGPPAPRSNRSLIVLALVGVAVLCLCGVPMGFFAWASTLPESGVRAGNQLDQKSRALVQRRLGLDTGEEIITFYDASISVDGSEAAVLTTSRLAYWKGDSVSELPIDEIAQLSTEDLGNDVVTVSASDGRLIRFEIAPLNDGALFISALERATGLTANGPARRPGEPRRPADPERPHTRRR